jgi:hypothetical protein
MKWSQLLNPPRGVGRLSLLAGYVAGEACSLYAIFIAHTMSPVSYRMVENNFGLRSIYGRYQEIYNLDGLAFTLIASFAVFAMALCVVRGIAWTIREGSFEGPCRDHVSRRRYRSLSLLTNRIPDAAIEWPSSTSVRCLRFSVSYTLSECHWPPQ